MTGLLLVGSVFFLSACKLLPATQPDANATTEPTAQEEQTTPEPTPDPTPSPALSGLVLSQDEISEAGNRANVSTFLKDGDWIYGHAWDADGGSILVKVREDGKDATVLDEGIAQYLTSNGGYLYYSKATSETDYGIYRMRLSGQGKERVVKAYGDFQIVGDSIYYANTIYIYSEENQNSGSVTVKSSECHLMRANLDGSDPVEIIAKPTFYFNVYDNGILYQDDNDNSALHVCALDGSADRKIADGFAFMPIFDGEYVYYTKRVDLDSTATIWRVKIDGTGEEQISKETVSDSFLLYGDTIYYTSDVDGERIYSMNRDGTGITLISQDGPIGNVQFFGKGLKYSQYAVDHSSMVGEFFCRLDGGHKDQFEPKLS